MCALPDLDLAFQCDGDLRPELRAAAGALGDPLEGAEPWHDHLSRWLRQLAQELPERLRSDSYSLGLSLTDDTAIAGLNADWRQIDGPTDVLAFAAQEEGQDGAPPMPAQGEMEAEAEPLELGDIVISLETAARQAQVQGHDLERELLFLASHGLLHLLGWDHPDEARLEAMLERQERLLAG